MRKEICHCDICGSAERIYSEVTTLVYRTFDGTEGRPYKDQEPHFTMVKADICFQCLMRSIKIKDVGVQCQVLRIE